MGGGYSCGARLTPSTDLWTRGCEKSVNSPISQRVTVITSGIYEGSIIGSVTSFNPSQVHYKVDIIIIPILQMRRPRHREVRTFAQGHTANM